VLLGDAAHPTTPNLGQGANMAIDDAIVLAASLFTTMNIAEAFRVYEDARWQRTSTMVRKSWQFGRLATWKNPLLVKCREILAKHTPSRVLREQLKQQILETVAGLPAVAQEQSAMF
jgi:2-polyprenyl-6-methoxyphenol hydroxylase-like FAD-dependent oxidoreductase